MVNTSLPVLPPGTKGGSKTDAPAPEFPQFFVKETAAGTKDGSSWDNAMGPEEVRTLLEAASDDAAKASRGEALDGAQIYFAAGSYVLNAGATPIVVDFSSYNGDSPTKYCDITLLGGFGTSLTGKDISLRDIDANVTVITASAQTAGLMEIRDAAHVTFDGFRFMDIKGGRVFYLNNGSTGRAMLDLDDCYMENCGDASKSSNMENTCVYLKQGIARLNHVIFNRCYGGGRGPVFGANTNNGYIFMNRCSIYGTQGVLSLPLAANFSGDVQIFRPGSFAPVPVLPAHGFDHDSRGVGAADLAWSLRLGRVPRADAALGLHCQEILHGIRQSGESKQTYRLTTRCERPAPLSKGYRGLPGFCFPEESSLIL